MKNPPILILDEATSALDTETERIIQKALTELAENRTTLIIAHRLATIRNADKIVVVTEEGIVEEGGHDDLLKQGAFFPIYINYNTKNDKKLYVLTRIYSFFNRMEWSSINHDFDKIQY